MPRTIDYSKTIQYKIVCRDLAVKDVYNGHTTDFRCRKNAHKTRCNNENNKKYNLKVYQTIRENGGWDNWEMVEIEKFSCQDGNEARARERYWFETLQSSLNSYIPNRTAKEWYVEKYKEYAEQNKEKIKEQMKEYREQHKEQIKEQMKEYREQTKEQKREYNKAYYLRKKAEKII